MKPKILAYSCLGLALGVGAFTLFDRTIPPIPAKSTKQKKLTREPVSTNSIEAAIVPTADQNYTLAWSIEWLSRYPQANIAEPTADDDNDGVNNYQEMLAGTNPGKAQASDDHAATLVHMSHSSPSVEEVSDNLKALAATAKREQPERERVLLERAKTFGIEVKRSQDGKIIHPFAISENGEIFRGTTLDVIAADTVGADELWPTPLWPIGGTTFPNFAHGSSGLNLTGAGQRIGMWEDWADLEFGGTIAGIDIDHGLFGTRMTQGEEDTDFNFIPDDFDVDSIQDFDVPDSNHASAVAGVMAGTGVSAFFGNYNFGEQARGIAYNSTVLAHERDGYDYEFPALADPLSANAITLANNSRGIASGWISDGAGGWKWFGNSTSTAVEDWRFGAYAGPSLFGGYDYFPSGLDNMANSAPYTLQVFSAGNSRNDGPTTLPASYLLGDGPTTSTFARDLTNGDDGGYDSLLPSSVAKNILTVADPKSRNFNNYQQVDLFKPNFKEFRDGLNLQIEKTEMIELKKASEKFKTDNQIGLLFITLSELGVFLTNGISQNYFPAEVRDIADVSGAGDTVIATASLCLAAGLPIPLMAQISNLAGGLVCEKLGVVPIDLEQLKKEVKKIKLD